MVLRRITSDIDDKRIKVLMKFIRRALILKPQELIIKPSNSKGFHLILWKDFPNLTKAQEYRLRDYLGDDPYRIKADKKRKIGKQTLFAHKEKTETQSKL